MNAQFRKLMQLGIVVPDAEKAAAELSERHGMGPWMGFDMLLEPVEEWEEGSGLEPVCIKCKVCNVFGFEIELVEPLSDGPYRRWLEKNGPGIHHMAVEPRDGYDGLIEAYRRETGKAPWLRAESEAPDGRIELCYLDYRDSFGAIIELYNGHTARGPMADD